MPDLIERMEDAYWRTAVHGADMGDMRAAARVMFEHLNAEMSTYRTTPGILVMHRVARENSLKESTDR